MFEAYPFSKTNQSSVIRDSEAVGLIELLMTGVAYIINVDPLGAKVADDGRGIGGGIENGWFTRREFIAAIWADEACGMNERLTLGTNFNGGIAGAVADSAYWINGIDGTMSADVAGKVEDEAVELAFGDAGATADDLDVETGALSRSKHGKQVDPRRVEARRQHVHVDQAAQGAAFEPGNNVGAVVFTGFTKDAFGVNVVTADFGGDVAAVINASAVDEPGLPIGAEADDLTDGGAGSIGVIDGGFELAWDEFAATGADTGHVELGLGLLGNKLTEVALVDEVANAGLVGDGIEQGFGAFVEHTAIEAVGRGGETTHL